jgi:hypothetical protein
MGEGRVHAPKPWGRGLTQSPRYSRGVSIVHPNIICNSGACPGQAGVSWLAALRQGAGPYGLYNL